MKVKDLAQNLTAPLAKIVLASETHVQAWLDRRAVRIFADRNEVGEYNRLLQAQLGISTTQVGQILRAAGARTLPTQKTLERERQKQHTEQKRHRIQQAVAQVRAGTLTPKKAATQANVTTTTIHRYLKKDAVGDPNV